MKTGFLALLVLVPTALHSQEPAPRPAYALHAGVGGHQGWVGGAAEGYLLRGRLSAWVGAGVLPGYPATPAWALALRVYPIEIAASHRLFVDVSRTLVGLTQDQTLFTASPTITYYRVGVTAGYSYVARSGVSFTAGGGVAPGHSESVVPLVHLAIGWTWRR
jgi:hypothetical protein